MIRTLCLAVLLLLPLNAWAGERIPLSASDLTELLSGRTETWSTFGAGYYHPDGKIDFVWKEKPGSGGWSITDEGVLCLQITQWYGDEAKCNWTYFRRDGDIYSLNLETDKATRMPGFTPGKTF